jgi:hypothetical protein
MWTAASTARSLNVMLYTALYMPATRTQIYLTPEQRRRLEARRKRERKTLAAVVREAIDAYLGSERTDYQAVLDKTFGSIPDLEVPSRREWDERERRIFG